ncbi:MAG TPA: glycosyltransferase family 1 protein [Acidimicrobiales bacterium]|nr:glycosyltransferase family 1 protein [Acidimicrobiales bacterium]
MRVLLVAQQLRRAVPGGIGTYVRGLVQGLGDEVDLTLLAGGDGLGPPVVDSHLPGKLLTRAWDAGLVKAPPGYDVVHAAALATPAASPLVVAVHDLAWRMLPDAFPRRGRAWHEAALRRAVARGARFVVPTTATADALTADVAAARIDVLDPMYGCDHLPPADTAAATELLHRLGVEGPYLLTVATLEPRKNLPRLLEAFARARPLLPDPWPLVVVGPPGWGEQVKPPPGVVLTGAVPPATLAAVYAGARCMAYVPLLEGWGLPAVEAMAACTPVVASPLPSTGGAVVEVDPYDPASIAAGLVVAASDERRRAELVTAGLLRAAELTWEAAARAHVAVWEGAAA